MEKEYRGTIYACFTGYIVQALINSFVPLLFVTLSNQYHISLSQITLMITVNFLVQLTVDMLSAVFMDRIGYRVCAVAAHIFVAVGLIMLTILPEILPNPLTGLVLSVMVYALGGGLLEVLVSPLVEACPTKNKESMMSLLHSFYCWGCIGVVLVSTLFFVVAGISHWKLLALLWALLPIGNAIAFTRVPIYSLMEEGEKGLTLKELFSNKLFWVLMLLMFCAGACEQCVSQWASTFAEKGLGVSKTIGDLAGPLCFSVFMGLSRLFYSKYGEKIQLEKFILGSGILCIISYLMISCTPGAVIGLLGCSVCGLSVGILWPGIFSIGSASIRNGGTAMFALFALAGDLGCGGGPTVVGAVSGYFNDNLKLGILISIVFPVVFVLGCLVHGKMRERAV